MCYRDNLLRAYMLLQRTFFVKYKNRLWECLPWEDNLICVGSLLSDDKWWISLDKETQDDLEREIAYRYDELTALGDKESCRRTLDFLRINEEGKGEYIPRFEGYYYIFVGLNKDYDLASKEYGDGRARYFYCLDREPWERQTESYTEGAIRIDFDALCRLSCKGTIVIISQEVEGEIREMLLGAGITNYYGHVEYRDKKKRILYGAGTDGARALNEFGKNLVEYFAENKVSKKLFQGKEVISFDEMVKLSDKYRIVVSSTGYRSYFEKRLAEAGVEGYDVYRVKKLPAFKLNGQGMSCLYTELIAPRDLQEGNRVLIVGTAGDMFALITEVRFCNGEVIGIVDTTGEYESVMDTPVVSKIEDIENYIDEFDVVLVNIEDDDNKQRIEQQLNKLFENRQFKFIDIYERLKGIESRNAYFKKEKFNKWDLIGHTNEFMRMVNYLGRDRIGTFYCLDSDTDQFKTNNDFLSGINVCSFEELDPAYVSGILRVISEKDKFETEKKLQEKGITDYYGQHKLKNDKTLVLFDDYPIDERTVKFVKNEYKGNVFTCSGSENDEMSYEKLRNNLEQYQIMLVSEPRYADQEYRLRKSGINNYIFFKWGERLPDFWLNGRRIERTFNYILNRKQFDQYEAVSIYGITYKIYDLISEIRIQYPKLKITGIVDPDFLYDEIMGIECIDLDTALKRSDCIVILDEYGDSDIRYKLEKMDINQGIIDLYDIMPDEPSVWCEDLEQYKNIHKGERCFIIGNGPSLKPEDLDILRASGEVCFATNDIDLMYDKTEWRPDYYVVAGLEQALVDLFENRLDSLPGTKFTTSWYQRNTRFYKSKEYHYFSQQAEFRNYDDLNHHLFSMDASKRVFECYTVVYTAFQLAAYMGFSEIYLLGVDNGGKGYFFQEEDYDAEFLSIGIHHNRAYRFERDWEEAEWYSQNHGFRIYNATRGGYLETFERVDFDSLF